MTPPPKLRILIADDHAIVREGLKQILAGNHDMAVVGEAETGFNAIRLVRDMPADVLLLDISLPDKNGIEVLKQVRKIEPNLSILMLSMHREDQYAIRSLKAGASGYMTKQSAPAELIDAIRMIAAGRKYVSAALAQELANHIADKNREGPPHEQLSDREFQTMAMIASGKTVSDIASELALSVKTISMYRSRLLKKMKMRHNAELTHYAIKNNLVE